MKPSTFIINSKKKEDNDHLIELIEHALVNKGFVKTNVSPEYVFVLGGDGSMMRSIHQYGFNSKYLLINTGHLGFYSDYSAAEIKEFINDLDKDEFIEEHVPLYEVKINGHIHYFLNDFAIQSGETCFLDISVNNELLTKVRANGIVISTPVGTTGYLTSLASPVVIGKPKIYQYSTIAPCYNRLSLNPINKAILDNLEELKVDIKEGLIETYLDGILRTDLIANSYSFKGCQEKSVCILHLKQISETKRLRKNISGLED